MSSHAMKALRACAALLAALCFAGGAKAQQGCEPVPLQPGAEGTGLCYGREAWREPTLGHSWRTQRFDFHRAPSSGPAPLIIWAHPNGMSKSLVPGTAHFEALVVPAIHAGFSFASIEFRHPVTNEDEANSATDPRVPHYDIARAVQFIRANADALGIDKRNIFLVGQSRGTLAIWTALQDDMARAGTGDPVDSESTRVNAVYGVQAQTTYAGKEFAQLFIVKDDRDDFMRDFNAQHGRPEQYGSAIRSVSAGLDPDPPVRLIYDAPVPPRRLTYDEMKQVDGLHYPGFGPALCQAYVAAFGNSARCSYDADRRYRGNPIEAFKGYVEFFKAHRVP